MAVRCPHKDCNTKMYIQENLLENPQTKIKCPSCKRIFKPFETLSKMCQSEILTKKERESKTLTNNEETGIYGSNKSSDNSEVVGWLVVHDENAKSQTYDLHLGRQLVGRVSQEFPSDIMIETTDQHMHREHFYIVIKKNGRGQYSYLLETHPRSFKGNGTFIDTKRLSEFERQLKRLSLGELIYMEDGALIQAGNTKMFLKTKAAVLNKQDATRIVTQQKYTKTILL